jgi:hypothetical protein
MKYDIFKLKECVIRFIFVTVIYKLLCILYKLFLYYPNEVIYRCCVFMYADNKVEYDNIVMVKSDNYKETRMANHSFITLIESMLLCIICIII